MKIDGLIVGVKENKVIIKQFYTGYKYLVPKDKILFERDKESKPLKRNGCYSVRVYNAEYERVASRVL